MRLKTITITVWDPEFSPKEHYSTLPICEVASNSAKGHMKIIVVDDSYPQFFFERAIAFRMSKPGSIRSQVLRVLKQLGVEEKLSLKDRLTIKLPNSSHAPVKNVGDACFYESGWYFSEGKRKPVTVKNGIFKSTDPSMDYLVSTFTFDSIGNVMPFLTTDNDIHEYFIGKPCFGVDDYEDYQTEKGCNYINDVNRVYFVVLEDSVLEDGRLFFNESGLNSNQENINTIQRISNSSRIIFLTKRNRRKWREQTLKQLSDIGIENPEIIWGLPNIEMIMVSNSVNVIKTNENSIWLGLDRLTGA